MRILLIGGSGFIGSRVIRALQLQGHTLALFHHGTSTVPDRVTEIKGDRHQFSRSGPELKAFAPDVVIDFLASSGHETAEVISALRGIANRVVMLSSIDVYRAVGISHGTESGPLQEVPLTEESELRTSLRPYTLEMRESSRRIFPWITADYDKIPSERVVMNDPGIRGTVLRLPMTYGPGDRLHRVYPIVKRISDGRRRIVFPQTLAAWRSPRGYVENVAAAIATAAIDDRAAGRIYNVCEEPSFSELEWAQKIAAAMNWTGSFTVLPDDKTPPHLPRPGNAAQHWSASSARIRKELGYIEPVSIGEAIRRTIEWEINNPPTAGLVPPFDYASEDAALARNER